MSLGSTVQSSLIARLNGALQFMSHNINPGACLQLDGFITQVQGAVLAGLLI
jgi:hypothetical protein